jgi:tetratricopeptide (TPR) repeat protein
MIRVKTPLAVALLTLALATAAQASWYDDYDAGLIAARKGAWSTVVQKMTAAISGQSKENSKARTYGMDFRNYRPYYYRGVAYLNLGKYDLAIADLEQTGGPGPENLGDLTTLLDRAKKMAAASNEPEPAPVRTEPRPDPVRPPVITPPVTTTTPAPALPQIDPAQRQRASAALAAVRQKLGAAQQRRAGASPQYSQASSIYNDATTRFGNARNNDDLSAVMTLADNAGDLADLAMPPNAPPPTVATTTPSPIIPKPVAATTQIIDEHADDVKRALELYFAGEFQDATKRFEKLTREMPNNGWIYAFLGASQYSVYAFEADESYRKAALKSFRKARQLRTWTDGLPSKYFSRRIRNAFREEG